MNPMTKNRMMFLMNGEPRDRNDQDREGDDDGVLAASSSSEIRPKSKAPNVPENWMRITKMMSWVCSIPKSVAPMMAAKSMSIMMPSL